MRAWSPNGDLVRFMFLSPGEIWQMREGMYLPRVPPCPPSLVWQQGGSLPRQRSEEKTPSSSGTIEQPAGTLCPPRLE